jgi:hypothetical protein
MLLSPAPIVQKAEGFPVSAWTQWQREDHIFLFPLLRIESRFLARADMPQAIYTCRAITTENENCFQAGIKYRLNLEPTCAEVEFRPTVSWRVCLNVGLRSVAHAQMFSSFWQLQVFCCGAPFLTRGLVCNLLVQLLLGLARAVTLGSKSHRTQTIFCCLIWDSPILEGQVLVFISPRNRVAQLCPWALGSLFVASYDSQSYRGGIVTRLHTCFSSYANSVSGE